MTKVVNLNEKREEIPAFEAGVKVQQGGKQPPDDWLFPMPKGTRFLARPGRSKLWMLYEFEVWQHSKHNVMLLDIDQDKFEWVHPLDFCDNFKLEEIIEIGDDGED